LKPVKVTVIEVKTGVVAPASASAWSRRGADYAVEASARLGVSQVFVDVGDTVKQGSCWLRWTRWTWMPLALVASMAQLPSAVCYSQTQSANMLARAELSTTLADTKAWLDGRLSF
jgi:hypothetical protein